MNMDAYTRVLTPLELAYAQSVADKAMIAEIHAMLAAKLIAEARNGPANAVQERPAPQRGGVALAPEDKIACQCADDAPEVVKKPSAIVVADAASIPQQTKLTAAEFIRKRAETQERTGGSGQKVSRLDAAKKMMIGIWKPDPTEPATFADIRQLAERMGIPDGTARTYFSALVSGGLIVVDPDFGPAPGEKGPSWWIPSNEGRKVITDHDDAY